MGRNPLKKGVPMIVLGCFMAATSGCMMASLATDTGPRRKGQQWSTAGRQQFHAGETVRFDFVLHDWRNRLIHPFGVADYCAVLVGNSRIETTPDAAGHFQFEYEFDDSVAGDSVPIRATAYQIRGVRDFVRVGDTWVQVNSARDEADRAVAGAAVKLHCYQLVIEFTVPRVSYDLQPDTGVLKLRQENSVSTSIFMDRPGRPGFSMSAQDHDGLYRVRYVPRGDELAASGVTNVEFRVHDTRGQIHYVTQELKTP